MQTLDVDEQAALIARQVARAASAWFNAPQDYEAYRRLALAVAAWDAHGAPTLDASVGGVDATQAQSERDWVDNATGTWGQAAPAADAPAGQILGVSTAEPAASDEAAERQESAPRPGDGSEPQSLARALDGLPESLRSLHRRTLP